MRNGEEVNDRSNRCKHRNKTTTGARIEWDGAVGTGVAKLLPGDHYNREIGERIALGRALMDIGMRYQNTWLLRSRTEAEVKKQRNRKQGTVVYNTVMRPASLTLNFKDVNTDAPRPKQKKAKQSR